MDDRHFFSLIWLNLSKVFLHLGTSRQLSIALLHFASISISYLQHIGEKSLVCIPSFIWNLYSALCLNDNIAVGK